MDVNDEQLKLAASMGADLTVNSRSEDAAKVIQEKTGGAHAAVVTPAQVMLLAAAESSPSGTLTA
ncbi:zinc-binding dehydrogenase [Enterobacter hormaechei]|uniref:zinc-binding dehydrogenase n=1 Tax=Enterobacter hormaechei TaxID=158836 RepID=UPI003CC631FB